MLEAPVAALARSWGYAVEGAPLDIPVTGPARDVDAGPEHIAWVSEDVVRAHPERIADCRAGVLVAPSLWLALHPSRHREGLTIRSDDPRTAFARIVNALFPAPDEATRCPWGTVVGPHSVVRNAVVGHNVTIGANCSIGLPGFGFVATGERFPHHGRVIIGDDVSIGSNVCIDRGALGDTVVRRGAKIDNLVHVAHNCDIGEDALIIAGATLCGGVRVGPGARIAPNAVVREQVTIGAGSVVGLGAVVVRDVDPGTTVVGNPAKPR